MLPRNDQDCNCRSTGGMCAHLSSDSSEQLPELDNELVICVLAILIVFSYLVIPQSGFIWTIRFAIAGAGGMLGSRTRGTIILILSVSFHLLSNHQLTVVIIITSTETPRGYC